MARASEEAELRMYAFFVLYFLHEKGELSGYELSKTIKERTKGYFSSTAGNVYPVLEDLEKRGLIRGGKPIGERRKRLFQVTAEGKKSLLEMAMVYKERLQRITAFFDKVIKEGID